MSAESGSQRVGKWRKIGTVPLGKHAIELTDTTFTLRLESEPSGGGWFEVAAREVRPITNESDDAPEGSGGGSE